MNKITFQQILLSIGTFLSIGTLGAIIFLGANIINDIKISQEASSPRLVFFFLVLSISSVIFAWFNRKIGGLLVMLSSILIIISNLIDFMDVSFYWQQGALFIVGLLLFFSVLNTKQE